MKAKQENQSDTVLKGCASCPLAPTSSDLAIRPSNQALKLLMWTRDPDAQSSRSQLQWVAWLVPPGMGQREGCRRLLQCRAPGQHRTRHVPKLRGRKACKEGGGEDTDPESLSLKKIIRSCNLLPDLIKPWT